MTSYSDGTDVIDHICNSSYVVSESLHGIIVAEAYRIPCVWVELREHFVNGGYKFDDFYYSIGKMSEEPVMLCNEELFQKQINVKLKNWKKR